MYSFIFRMHAWDNQQLEKHSKRLTYLLGKYFQYLICVLLIEYWSTEDVVEVGEFSEHGMVENTIITKMLLIIV